MTELNAVMQVELAALFKRFDVNGDGNIDEQEFGLMLEALGEPVSQSTLSLQFGLIDTNGDGAVDFNEFADWWLDAQ